MWVWDKGIQARVAHLPSLPVTHMGNCAHCTNYKYWRSCSQRENSSARENRSFTELYKLDLLYGYFRFPLAKGLAGRKKSHPSSRKYVMRTSELADHTVYVWCSNICQQLVHKLSNTSSIPPNPIIWGQRGGSTIKIISFSFSESRWRRNRTGDHFLF